MKVLLIGWDAADKSILEQLLERGLMPHLELFCSRASSADLQLVRPWDSAALWTSIVTGKRATDHGVVNGVEVDPTRTQIRTTCRWACTARPVWSVLSEAGHSTHACGWPASHPAEPINGVAVSDQFAEFGDDYSVHPPRLLNSLRALRLLPTDIDAASLVTLLPRAAELNPAADRRLCLIARFLAATASLHAAATWALEHEPWDFAAVRYAGLGELLRVFGPSFAAAQAGERSHDADLFGDLIPNAYRFFDMLLGRLLELAGPDSSVMLVSQHGWTPSWPVKPESLHLPPGILIANGPAIMSCKRLSAASVCDIAPTILRLFGLPPEPGTHGRALRDLLSKAADATASAADADRPTSELTGHRDDSLAARNSEPFPPDDDSVAQPIAPMCHDQPDESLRIAIEQLDRERQLRLAEAWSDAGKYDRAARLLEQLVQIEPTSIPFRSALAEANFRAGSYDGCRRLIESLRAEGIDTPLTEIGLAAADAREGRSTPALEHLRRAEAMGGASAGMLELIGRLYLKLRRHADASRALNAAIAIDPALASAHDGGSVACLLAGNAIGAERYARKAVELGPHSFDARYHLGVALARQSRFDEAIDVLQSAVALDHPGGASAHRHLADLLERRGDRALASHHRAQSHRKESTVR